MYHLAYANKKLPISKDRRNRWIELIERARLYSSFAQEGEQASRSARYRIGIFPGGGRFGWIADVGLEERVARTLQTSIQRNRALTLVYSYYDDVLNEPRIKNRDRLWVGGQVKKKPNLELVYALARERELDGVVMMMSGITTLHGTSVDLYLIDVERRQVYRRKGTTKKSSMDKLSRKLVAQFLADRPHVVLAKATPSEPTTVTPTAVPTKEVVTPTPTKEDQQASRSALYRIGVFPGGGNFGEGYQGALEERVARLLQANIKQNRALVLAYSFYDEMLNEPRIKNRDRFWVGGQVKKKPNAEVVYTLARERELDGVVTCWGHSLPSSYYTESPQRMWVYLIDVAERKVYRKKGTTKKSDVDKLTRNVVAQFLADRPQVMQAKRADVQKEPAASAGGIFIGQNAKVPGTQADSLLQADITRSLFAEESKLYKKCERSVLNAELYAKSDRSIIAAEMGNQELAGKLRATGDMWIEKWFVKSCDVISPYEVLLTRSLAGGTDIMVKKIAFSDMDADDPCRKAYVIATGLAAMRATGVPKEEAKKGADRHSAEIADWVYDDRPEPSTIGDVIGNECQSLNIAIERKPTVKSEPCLNSYFQGVWMTHLRIRGLSLSRTKAKLEVIFDSVSTPQKTRNYWFRVADWIYSDSEPTPIQAGNRVAQECDQGS